MAHQTFHVTEDDIQQGWRDSCPRCPVVRAISRAVGRTVAVGGINALSSGRVEYLTGDGLRVAHDLPQKVGEKILCYAQTGMMAPFVFALHASEELRRCDLSAGGRPCFRPSPALLSPENIAKGAKWR